MTQSGEGVSSWTAWSIGGKPITVTPTGQWDAVTVYVGDVEVILGAGHVEQLIAALDGAVRIAWPGEDKGERILSHVLEHRR